MCECYKIDGPFIDVDPDCPIHNKNHRDYQEDQSDVIEQLQARIAELTAEVERLRDVEMTSATRWATGYHELRDQLATAREEIRSRDDFISMLQETQKDQLATAEQRVAEACALQVATEIKFPWFDADRVAKEIRSGEWRKFVKEV